MRVRIEGQPPGVRVELERIEIPSALIRLAAIEYRRFELPFMCEYARGDHTERDVRRVLPMVTYRCEGVVRRGRPMHERDRSEGRLTRGSRVDRNAGLLRDGTLVHCAELHPEVV